MPSRQLFNFRLTYKVNGEIFLESIEGINLRHAKEKITFKYPEATDLMDWTNEKEDDISAYIKKSALRVNSSVIRN